MNKEFSNKGKTIKTQRALLRPFTIDDLDDLFEYAKVPGVGEKAGWPHHETIEDSLKILNMFIEDEKVFAIVIDDKVVGSLGIECYKEDYFPEFKDKYGREIGYVLSKEYWGKGLMSEIVKEAIKFLFEKEKLDFIVCACDVTNVASKRVQEKSGFSHTQTLMHTNVMGETSPAYFSYITKEEYYSFSSNNSSN